MTLPYLKPVGRGGTRCGCPAFAMTPGDATPQVIGLWEIFKLGVAAVYRFAARALEFIPLAAAGRFLKGGLRSGRTPSLWCPTGAPSLSDLRWEKLMELLLLHALLKARVQIMNDQWSSWARLGNVLRHHRWETARQIQNQGVRRRPPPGPAARAHPATAP